MITLKDGSLSFGFPEISQELQSLLDQHIWKILPNFALPTDRESLVRELQAGLDDFDWQPMTFNEIRGAQKTANALTEADVETTLRKIAIESARIEESRFALTVTFHRTLRIPDDGRTYPLPAGLGKFPLQSVDDFPDSVPAEWLKRGGVMMPMYQSEALWMEFSSAYPFALKVAAGKINAVSGEPWNPTLQSQSQNYVVVPQQPWLDGFSVDKGIVRQFVAMPLGTGYSVEEQLTGQAEFGGIQLQAHPMRAESYFCKFVISKLPSTLPELLPILFKAHLRRFPICAAPDQDAYSESSSMGLGAGGTMRHEIYEDPYRLTDWDDARARRCFVHLCDSLIWREITGANPPHPPFTSSEYKQAGIPWYDYYRDDLKPLDGSAQLAGVKSVAQFGKEKNDHPVPENTTVLPQKIIQYGNTRRPREFREFLEET